MTIIDFEWARNNGGLVAISNIHHLFTSVDGKPVTEEILELYSDRSAMHYVSEAVTGRHASPYFVELTKRICGVECVEDLQSSQAKFLQTYVPHVDVFEEDVGCGKTPLYSKDYAEVMTNLRNKVFSTIAVLNGDVDVNLLYGTRVFPTLKSSIDGIAKHVNDVGEVFVKKGGENDGGYGNMLITKETLANGYFHKFISDAHFGVVSAPYIKDIVARPGVTFNSNRIFAPNTNIDVGEGSVGIVWPSPAVLLRLDWVNDVLLQVKNLKRYVEYQLNGEKIQSCNGDFIVVKAGTSHKIYWMETGARATNASAVAERTFTLLRRNGYTKSFEQFLWAMSFGKNGISCISNDKIYVSNEISLEEIEKRLKKAGIQTFDGKKGWSPTHGIQDGYAGLHFLCITDPPDSRKALLECAQMYTTALKALGVEYRDELAEVKALK